MKVRIAPLSKNREIWLRVLGDGAIEVEPGGPRAPLHYRIVPDNLQPPVYQRIISEISHVYFLPVDVAQEFVDERCVLIEVADVELVPENGELFQ